MEAGFNLDLNAEGFKTDLKSYSLVRKRSGAYRLMAPNGQVKIDDAIKEIHKQTCQSETSPNLKNVKSAAKYFREILETKDRLVEGEVQNGKKFEKSNNNFLQFCGSVSNMMTGQSFDRESALREMEAMCEEKTKSSDEKILELKADDEGFELVDGNTLYPQELYERLNTHFKAVEPVTKPWYEVNDLESFALEGRHTIDGVVFLIHFRSKEEEGMFIYLPSRVELSHDPYSSGKPRLSEEQKEEIKAMLVEFNENRAKELKKLGFK